jgi:hypothetical protein
MTTATDIQIGKVFRLLLCTALLACGLSLQAEAATFVVTNTADSGFGSLRNAIAGANQNPGPDIINFGISSQGSVKTIVLQSDLPVITETLTIDGWSQGGPGYQGTPLIELRGGERNQIGLFVGTPAPNSLIRGLIINGFSYVGIGIPSPADHVTVQGCYIGTTADGNSALPNGIGISIVASHCLIGGPNPQDRNVISGNKVQGIFLDIFSGDARIEGNYIGVSASGLAPVGNYIGLNVRAPNNTIGGTDAGKRNVISGNLNAGIQIDLPGNRVQGNYIGVAPDGVTAMGNGAAGINIVGVNNVIGGGSAKAGNVISDNYLGINVIEGGGNRIQNNLIGVGADRTTPLGNRFAGIWIDGNLNVIGGRGRHFRGREPSSERTGNGNIIANNGGSGVLIYAGKNNLISLNSIYNNGVLGIDLVPEGVTDNDVCDLDTGPNNLQNFPLINKAVASTKSGGEITIYGTLSTAGGKLFVNANYRLEFFSNSSCSSSGNGEGKTFLGEAIVSIATGLCQADFTATFKGRFPRGTVITATATDSVNNTSEFSPCAPISFGGGLQ